MSRNESTISRAVNDKYIQTPYGIFELRQIAALIEDEGPQHPLSDDKIVTILRGQGINIARRTVAKYREGLKILPSHLRKR